MLKGIFITGTDTGVGKTIVTACVTALLQEQKINSIPYKPIQSGAINTGEGLIAEDVEVYRKVLGFTDKQEKYCTYALKAPVSPHLAAKKEGRTLSLKKIEAHFHALKRNHDLVIVEGAGGLGVPLIEEKDRILLTGELIHRLQLPILLVTHPGLGTINHTLLSVSYARSLGIPILGLIVNQWPEHPTEMEKDNIKMMEKLCQIPILGLLPSMPAPAEEYIVNHWPKIRNSFNREKLLALLKEETKNERTIRTMG